MALSKSRMFAVLCLAVAVYFASNDPAVEKAKQKEALRRAPVAYTPPASQCKQSGQIALTFNQGIATGNTPPVLDVLKAAQVTATFFVSPEWVGKMPIVDAILRRIVNEGHTLGFAWWGKDPRNMTSSQLRSTLIEYSNMIYNAAGVVPRYMRFPYESTNQATAEVASSLGLILSSWNVDTLDYQACDASKNYTAQQMVDGYKSQLDMFKTAGNLQGAFIGSHTDLCPISSGVGAVIELGKNYSYKFVDISECLNTGAKYRSAPDSAAPLVEGGTPTGTTTTTQGGAVSTGTSTPQGNDGKQQVDTGKSAAGKAAAPQVAVLLAAIIAALAMAMF